MSGLALSFLSGADVLNWPANTGGGSCHCFATNVCARSNVVVDVLAHVTMTQPLFFEASKGVVLKSSNGKGVLDGGGITPIMYLDCVHGADWLYPCDDDTGADVELQVRGFDIRCLSWRAAIHGVSSQRPLPLHHPPPAHVRTSRFKTGATNIKEATAVASRFKAPATSSCPVLSSRAAWQA